MNNQPTTPQPMTDNNHPITPPPELIQQWWEEADKQLSPYYDYIATKAAQWGYEQRGAVNEAELQKARDDQLEACCAWLDAYEAYEGQGAVQMHEDLRPKPKSQAEKALASLDGVALPEDAWQEVQAAIERLRELEALHD